VNRTFGALLCAAALAVTTAASAQIADDGARPLIVAPPAVSPPAATPPAPATAPGAPVAVQQSWFIIIQFTDRNDAYLRGRPVVPPTPQGAPTIGDTIKGISQRFGIEYMGARYDPVTQTYMLRYMRNGEVVNFYVDARTHKVVGREGF
jgi:hypothetical protein